MNIFYDCLGVTVNVAVAATIFSLSQFSILYLPGTHSNFMAVLVTRTTKIFGKQT